MLAMTDTYFTIAFLFYQTFSYLNSNISENYNILIKIWFS